MKWTNSLKRHILSKFTQGQIDNLNRPIILRNGINHLKKKAPSQDRFTGEYYHTFKKEIIPIIYNHSHKTEAKETFPNSFYEASFILTSKPGKDIARKKT